MSEFWFLCLVCPARHPLPVDRPCRAGLVQGVRFHPSFIDIFEVFAITRVRASANTCLLGVAMQAFGGGYFLSHINLWFFFLRRLMTIYDNQLIVYVLSIPFWRVHFAFPIKDYIQPRSRMYTDGYGREACACLWDPLGKCWIELLSSTYEDLILNLLRAACRSSSHMLRFCFHVHLEEPR